MIREYFGEETESGGNIKLNNRLVNLKRLLRFGQKLTDLIINNGVSISRIKLINIFLIETEQQFYSLKPFNTFEQFAFEMCGLI